MNIHVAAAFYPMVNMYGAENTVSRYRFSHIAFMMRMATQSCYATETDSDINGLDTPHCLHRVGSGPTGETIYGVVPHQWWVASQYDTSFLTL